MKKWYVSFVVVMIVIASSGLMLFNFARSQSQVDALLQDLTRYYKI